MYTHYLYFVLLFYISNSDKLNYELSKNLFHK